MCSMHLHSNQMNGFIESTGNPKDAASYLDQLVNGNFLRCKKTDSLADKVVTCLSTICVLCKDFNQDWVAEGLQLKSLPDQKDFMACFGAYLEVPLRTVSDLLTRLRLAGREPRIPNFQRMASQFFGRLGESPTIGVPSEGSVMDGRVLLIVYLATALQCHTIWQRRQTKFKPIPWTLSVPKSGRAVLLTYTCWRKDKSRGNKLVRSKFVYKLPAKLAPITVDGIRYTNKL